MPLPLYLAMTAAEISVCQQLPQPLAYMACHFSPYSTGLSNLPQQIPNGSMLILNDRIPICGHDPALVAQQLQQLCKKFQISSLLLDLQRPEVSETERIVHRLLEDPVCAVGVSDKYAKGLDCPVFLSAPPLHRRLENWLEQWADREIWLEAALDGCTYTVTESGSIRSQTVEHAPLPCPELCCHYGILQQTTQVQITLTRTREDLQALLALAQQLGIKKAIGLYQQIKPAAAS